MRLSASGGEEEEEGETLKETYGCSENRMWKGRDGLGREREREEDGRDGPETYGDGRLASRAQTAADL